MADIKLFFTFGAAFIRRNKIIFEKTETAPPFYPKTMKKTIEFSLKCEYYCSFLNRSQAALGGA